MTTTNWREFAEQLLRHLEDDLLREVADLDVRFFAENKAGETVEIDVAKTSPSELQKADQLVEAWYPEHLVGEFIHEWRRRLWSAQIVADREERRVA